MIRGLSVTYNFWMFCDIYVGIRRNVCVLLIFTYLFVVSIAQNAEQDVDVCSPITNSRARLVHIHSPYSPARTTRSRRCVCNVTSSQDLPLYAAVTLFISKSVESVHVNYERDGDTLTWSGDSFNVSVPRKQCGGFKIIDSTSFVQVVYKDVNISNSVFSLEVGTLNKSDELRITCTQVPIDTTENREPDKTDVLQYIESYCSSYILIILGSVCAAFLVIILVLAIMLCCTVRKNTSYKMRHPSNASQPLSTQSSLGLPMESYRVASRIYDDGAAYRGSENGDQLPVPRHHSLPTVRQSAAYANTLDMNIYGNA